MKQAAARIIETTWAMFCIPSRRTQPVDVDALPHAVVAAVRARFPTARLRRAARDVRDGRSSYRIGIDVGGSLRAIRATLGGRIIAVAE